MICRRDASWMSALPTLGPIFCRQHQIMAIKRRAAIGTELGICHSFLTRGHRGDTLKPASTGHKWYPLGNCTTH